MCTIAQILFSPVKKDFADMPQGSLSKKKALLTPRREGAEKNGIAMVENGIAVVKEYSRHRNE